MVFKMMVCNLGELQSNILNYRGNVATRVLSPDMRASERYKVHYRS